MYICMYTKQNLSRYTCTYMIDVFKYNVGRLLRMINLHYLKKGIISPIFHKAKSGASIILSFGEIKAKYNQLFYIFRRYSHYIMLSAYLFLIFPS